MPVFPHRETIARTPIVDPGANVKAKFSTTNGADAKVDLSYILNVKHQLRSNEIERAERAHKRSAVCCMRCWAAAHPAHYEPPPRAVGSPTSNGALASVTQQSRRVWRTQRLAVVVIR